MIQLWGPLAGLLVLFLLLMWGTRFASSKSGMQLLVSLLVVAAAGAMYWGLGHYSAVAKMQQAEQQLEGLLSRAMRGQGEPLSEAELQQLALGLRLKLEQKADDPRGWLLLGRVATMLRNGEQAMLAFERAYRLDPDSPMIVRSYAEMLLMSQAPELNQRAVQMLTRLAASPEETEALSLLGFHAYQQQDLSEAIRWWRLLLARLPDSDSRREMITQTLENLTAQLEQQDIHSIGLRVTIAESLAGQFAANDLVLVYAKAAAGPPMPLAVKRLSAGQLPVEVRLSDADAMMEQMKLSSFEQIELIARISKDGDIKPSPGDLEGRLGPLQQAELNDVIDLVIDTRIE